MLFFSVVFYLGENAPPPPCIKPKFLAPKTKQRLEIKLKQKRAWQRMLSGRRLDLLDPTPMDIEVEDIAHGLSFVARWNGQTHGDFPYSVAEHSLLVLRIFEKIKPKANVRERMFALLHDAPEYVIGDMISPVKHAVGSGYEDLDQRLTAAIHIRFGLPAKIPAELKKQIKQADKFSARLEASKIAGFSDKEADKLFGVVDEYYVEMFEIKLRPPKEVRNEFITTFHKLLNQK